MSSYYVLPNSQGQLIPVTEEEHIRYCLKAILLCEAELLPNGETSGSNIRSFLYRPLNSNLQREVTSLLTEAVSKQEPRIEIQTLSVAPDSLERSKLQIAIQYLVKATQRTQRLNVSLTSEGHAYAY